MHVHELFVCVCVCACVWGLWNVQIKKNSTTVKGEGMAVGLGWVGGGRGGGAVGRGGE